jgi:hypothetical protein
MADKKTVWITYAWADNQQDDVDFIAQELEKAGLKVKLDRWTIKAGQKLWPQIEEFIQSPEQCDAWLMVATQNSLGSEPCKEEYAYALDRALRTRGTEFPVIALFPSQTDASIIPAGIRVRLHVSITDPDWKERIVAAAQGRQADIVRKQVQPFAVHVYDSGINPDGSRRPYIVELRPRAGTWAPFFAAIPAAEKDAVSPRLIHGPAGRTPEGMFILMGTGTAEVNGMYACFAGNEATPTMSYFLACNTLPSRIDFGVDGRQPQYSVKF